MIAAVFGLLALLLVPVIVLEMWWYRDKSASTWWLRYKDTPGIMIFQISICSCFWAFVPHVLSVIFTWTCDLCRPVRNWDSHEHQFRHSYFMHVFPALVIGVLGPFQFIEKVRKYRNFLLHRWFGRTLLTCSVVHQASASAMIYYEIMYSSSPIASDFHYRCYTSSFACYNLYAWVSIVFGWRAALRKDIPAHGAWMHRLGTMWFAIVVAFRILPMPLTAMFGPGVALAVTGWGIFIGCVVAVEVFLAKSGRFEGGKQVPKDGLQCPFLGEGK